jgi:hypothetical protein
VDQPYKKKKKKKKKIDLDEREWTKPEDIGKRKEMEDS